MTEGNRDSVIRIRALGVKNVKRPFSHYFFFRQLDMDGRRDKLDVNVGER